MNDFIEHFYSLFPLIKLFHVNNLIYLYDGKTRLFAQCDMNELELIYKFNMGTEVSVPPSLQYILDNKILSPGPLEKIVPEDNEIMTIIEEQIHNYIPRKLILEVTEKCTLRCKYCFFTGPKNSEHVRRHSLENMTFDVAKKTIDYYYEQYFTAVNRIDAHYKDRVAKSIPPHLLWWGGEPFMNFELMLQVKLYFESLNWAACGIEKNDIVYVVVTNLTILNQKIIDFLVHNSIHLLVSLDGDENEHNRNRVYPDDTGSFNNVINNINTLIDNYPEYTKNNMVLQPVLADNNDNSKTLDFINKYFELDKPTKKVLAYFPLAQRRKKLFLPKNFQVNSLLDEISSFHEELKILSAKSKADIEFLFRNDKRLYVKYQDFFMVENKMIFDEVITTDYQVQTFSCPLAIDTIFVSINGDIHSCCKVDYSFPLGNIETGLDKNILAHTYKLYFKEINKKCKKCWANAFCRICPAMVCWDGEFCLPTDEECTAIRMRIETLIMKYIILSTQYEDLYSYLYTFYNRNYDYRFDSVPLTFNDIAYEKN